MPEELNIIAAADPVVAHDQGTPLRAYAALSAATVCWVTNADAVKLAVREVPQLAAVALRVTLAGVTLGLLHLLRGGRFHLRADERNQLLKLSISGVSLSFFCFTIGLNYTSVSHAVFLNSLVPIAVLLIARMQGLERITPPKLLGLLLSVTGALSLALDQRSGRGPGLAGDLLIIASACSFAYFTVGSKKIASSHESIEFTAYTFLAAALWFSPLLVWELARMPWRSITWLAWSSLLYSAVFGSAMAYLTYYYSLRLIPASRAAAYHYLQPILATVLGVLIFHDRFTVRFSIGAALILAGLSIANQPRLQTRSRSREHF